jgi:hypothetical protein
MTHPRDDEALKTLVTAEKWGEVLDHCTEGARVNHGDYSHVWALAMTALYGRTGVHESRLTNGVPDRAKCLDVPEVFEGMARAAADAKRFVA